MRPRFPRILTHLFKFVKHPPLQVEAFLFAPKNVENIMKILAVNILRELLRILLNICVEMSNRNLGRIVGCSHQTIGRIKAKLSTLPYSYDQYEAMSDSELMNTLYPAIKNRKSKKRRPDLKKVAKELGIRPKKYGKKTKLMWLEYRNEEPSTALGQTQFYQVVKDFINTSKLEMHQDYYPGEYLGIDFAGMTVFVSKDGKKKLYVFVACLSYSNKMFAYVTEDMTADSWIEGLTAAVNYFGRTALVILFDNAKAMVRKPGVVAEISDKAIDFANYHDCLCDTSRVGTPRDNCNTEKSVQFIENRILVEMRRMTFFSRKEMNNYLLSEVEKLNNEVMQGYDETRNQRFHREFDSMLEIPAERFQPILKHSSIKSSAKFLVRYGECKYSVPYQYRNHMIEYKATAKDIRLYADGKLVAEHAIAKNGEKVICLDEHLPPNQLAQNQKTKPHFIEWAKEYGENTVALIEEQYGDRLHTKAQLAGKLCVKIKKMAESFSTSEFEKIATYAIDHDMTSPSDIKLIIDTDVVSEIEILEPHIIEHVNVRGSNHYAGRV